MTHLCNRCGSTLTVSPMQLIGDTETFVVWPCDRCLESSEIEARLTAYNRGYADGGMSDAAIAEDAVICLERMRPSWGRT